MTQHVFLDTGVLVPLLWERDRDLEATAEAIIQTLRGEIQTNDKVVKIPKIAVGEAVDRYLRDVEDGSVGVGREPPADRVLANLLDVKESVDAVFESVQTRCIEVARELHQEDGGRMLRHNDLIIASIAIADPDSTHLVAFDDDYLECQAIRTVAARRFDDGDWNYGLTVAPQYARR